MKYLLNPFRFIAGGKALLWGLVIMSVSALIAWQSNTRFNGVLDIHFTKTHVSIDVHFIEFLVDWLLMTLFFYTAGRITSRSQIRLIDMAGTMALARAPLFFATFLGFLPLPDLKTIDVNNIDPMLIIAGVVSMIFAICMVAWMFQAYTTSANLKGSKAVISFIVTLIIVEIVSFSIINNL